MPKLRISRTTLDRIEPSGTSVYYFDATLAGFAVRVSPKGIKAFLAQGYCKGVKHRRTLGRYPTTSPENARKAAFSFLSALGNGAAPLRAARTGDLLERWLKEHGKKLKPGTLADYRKVVAKHLKPALGKHLVAEITREMLAQLHDARSATPRRANYIIAVARSFFSWVEDIGLRPQDTNPAKRIRPYPEVKRERFLSEIEITRVAAAIATAEALGRISPFAAAALRLCILTGARSGEMTTLRWAEVDFERRLLLLSDSKTGRKPIWLSTPAIEILRTLPRISGNPYVFPGELAGEHYRNLRRAWSKVGKIAGLGDVRLHDLRHTFASHGAAAGFSLPVIGALLGHQVPATTHRYAHLAAHPISDANERLGLRLAAMLALPAPAEEQQ